MTGAKALFCLTAGKTEEENGRMEDVLEDPTVGLEDMTASRGGDFRRGLIRKPSFLNMYLPLNLLEKVSAPR